MISVPVKSSTPSSATFPKVYYSVGVTSLVPLYTEGFSLHRVGVLLYTEVSSFQGIGIEEFYCVQRCPHFRMLE